MVELSGFTQYIMTWIVSPLMWLLILVFTIIGVFLIIYIRKKRKLIYPTAEITEYGINMLKSGWFGKKTFFKMWDYGEETIKTKDGEEILKFSEEDFQEVNGERGIICYRNPVNRFLFPISQLKVNNKEITAEIPKREYIDAVLDIINVTENELKDWKEKLIQFIMWAGIIVFSLVSIIVIAQMVKNGQDKANDLILQAGQTCLTNAREICSSLYSTINSNAP